MGTGRKLMFGVGHNDADYVVQQKETIGYRLDGRQIQKFVWTCPFYRAWKGMLERCYSEAHHKRASSYIGCTVSEEWKTFSKFKAWMETQDWEEKQLDKDLLVPGNKVYSADTCVFVEQRINSFVLESNSSRGEWPIGVHWHETSSTVRARIHNGSGDSKHLGCFESASDAHKAWLVAKLQLAKELASEIIAEGGDVRVAKAIVERYKHYIPV